MPHVPRVPRRVAQARKQPTAHRARPAKTRKHREQATAPRQRPEGNVDHDAQRRQTRRQQPDLPRGPLSDRALSFSPARPLCHRQAETWGSSAARVDRGCGTPQTVPLPLPPPFGHCDSHGARVRPPPPSKRNGRHVPERRAPPGRLYLKGHQHYRPPTLPRRAVTVSQTGAARWGRGGALRECGKECFKIATAAPRRQRSYPGPAPSNHGRHGPQPQHAHEHTAAGRPGATSRACACLAPPQRQTGQAVDGGRASGRGGSTRGRERSPHRLARDMVGGVRVATPRQRKAAAATLEVAALKDIPSGGRWQGDRIRRDGDGATVRRRTRWTASSGRGRSHALPRPSPGVHVCHTNRKYCNI